MKKRVFLFLCLAVGVYLLSGIRILNQTDYYNILDSNVFSMTPKIITSKLGYAIFPLLSFYKYQRNEQTEFLHELDEPFKSREDTEFFIEGSVSFYFDRETLARSHLFIKENNFYPVNSSICYEPLQKYFSSFVMPKPEMQMKWFQINRDAASILTEHMKNFGIVLNELKLDKVFFKSDKSLKIKPLNTKILFIGLDGGEWDILNPLMQAGKLPNLKKLKENGSSGKLLTINPSLSPIVWTSIATGKKPEKHGIMDFLAIDERTGKKVPVTSNLRKAKSLWNILGNFGIRTGIIGWWATWPAEKINGYIITDRIAYQLFGITSRIESEKGKTYPPELYSQIVPIIVKPEQVMWDDIKRFFGPATTMQSFSGEKNKLLEDLETLYASSETYKNIFLSLDEKEGLDFSAVYFEGTDTIAHLFMRYRKPQIAGVTDDEIKAFGDTVDSYYEYIDGIVGEILNRKSEDWTIVICSDHGFKTGSLRPTSYDARIDLGRAAQWHGRYGIFIISGKNIKKGAFVEDGRILDLFPTVLALYGLPVGADMDGRVLTEVLEPEFLKDHPVKFINSYEEELEIAALRSPVESDIDQDIKEKLRSLGYISADSDNSFNNRGLVLMGKGDFDGAIEQFQKAISLNPRFTAAMINLGSAKMQKQELDDAIGIFEKVLQVEPDNIEVENLVGNAYMEKGDYRSAEDHFKKALSTEPLNADILNSLGILYEKEGRLDEAIDEYAKTIKIDPNFAEGYNNIGNIWKAKGREDEAIQWYRKAIEADPFFIGSYNNLALICQEKGDYEQAIRYYNQALEKAPNSAIVMNNLGSLYFNQGDMESAIDLWEKSIETSFNYESPYNNLGAAYGRKGMFNEEITMYQKALDINPEYVDARENLGAAYLRKGEYEKGIRELDQIVLKYPQRIKSWLLLAKAYIERGENKEALNYLEKGLLYDPKNVILLNLAGEVSYYLNDRSKAMSYFQKSLKEVPDQENIKMKIRMLSSK